MTHRVTLIKGDGIGPEVVDACVQVLKAAQVPITYDEQLLGLAALKQFDKVLPEATLNSIKANGVALKGPTTTPVGSGHQSANVALRKALDLYACIRPVKSLPGVASRYEKVDLLVVRENTEGLYGAPEIAIHDDCVISLRVVTRRACERIASKAFSLAQKEGRRKVTAVHKANILKKGDGLFLDCMRKIAKEYPQIAYDEAIIDALCMRLVLSPSDFDVLVLENMFGDIVSDLAAGLVGGLGLAGSANLGEHQAVFEAVHGSAPDIAGKNLANPTAMIQSALMMLSYLGETKAQERIQKALFQVFQEKHCLTRDLGGKASTKEFTQAVISALG